MRAEAAPSDDRALLVTRLIDAPRRLLFKAWTDPELLKRWAAPRPSTTTLVEIDARPGGANRVVIRDPEGNDYPHQGVYLEVVENERIVFTDAFSRAWEPAERAFMTVIATFENQGGKTRYTACARHWSVEDREAHERMGFHETWGTCTDQLERLVIGLKERE